MYLVFCVCLLCIHECEQREIFIIYYDITVFEVNFDMCVLSVKNDMCFPQGILQRTGAF